MTPKPSYEAASTGAILMDRSSEGRLRVTGADRVTWLQGLVTNDVAALAPGDGCYAAWLTPQGRMISDLRILAFDDSLLLDVPAGRRVAVLERIDQFIITEDVAVADESPFIARIGLHGPRAPAVIVGALEETDAGLAERLSALREHQHLGVELAGEPVVIAGARDIGRPGYDIYAPAQALPDIAAALSAAGAVDVDAETWDILRIEAGRPLFGVDMNTDTIPLEAGLESRAISQTKGCYVGQEIIIRVLHRGAGRVARRLVGLVSAAGSERERAPAHGDVLRAADREVGRVTSAAWSPRLNCHLAMGYVHRDSAEPGTRVFVDLDSPLEMSVTPLPFSVPDGVAV